MNNIAKNYINTTVIFGFFVIKMLFSVYSLILGTLVSNIILNILIINQIKNSRIFVYFITLAEKHSGNWSARYFVGIESIRYVPISRKKIS